MEIEQMDIDETIDSNNLSHPINAKSKKNKKSKFNFDFKKISIFSIFFLTIIAFIVLYNLNPTLNPTKFVLEKNEKEKKEIIRCDVGYKLVDGKCVINYSFKAEFKTQRDMEEVEFIKTVHEDAIKELIVDGRNIKPTTIFEFEKKGLHTVHMLLDMDKVENLNGMFAGIISFSSIAFTELFNTEKFTSMGNMFRNCKSLISADLSKFNTKNIKKMDFAFSGCTSLSSVDLSNFSNENLVSMSRMFFHCYALESLDMSGFKTTKVEDMSYAFADCNKLNN